MSKRAWMLLLLIALVIVVGFFLFIPAPEPHYQGRSLSAWLVQAEQDQKDPVKAEIARSAVRKIGTNALPFLVRWTESPVVPNLKIKLIVLLQQARGNSLGRICIPESFSGVSAFERFRLAGVGFGILGPVAAPAAPELARKLRAAPDWPTATACVLELFAIGPKGIPYLCETITNDPPGGWTNTPNWTQPVDDSPRVIAIKFLAQETNVDCTLPTFIQAMRDQEIAVALHATLAVGLTGRGHPTALAALTNVLMDARPKIRAWAVDSISRLGNEGEPAIPYLLTALNDEDAAVRQSATNALSLIAPGTFAKNSAANAH